MHERKHRSACVYYTELAQKYNYFMYDARASIRCDARVIDLTLERPCFPTFLSTFPEFIHRIVIILLSNDIYFCKA